MIPKELNVDFYRPSILSEGGETFADLLNAVMAIPEGEDRVAEIKSCPIYLRSTEVVPEGTIGEMVKLRVNEPAIKGNKVGTLAPVALRSGEALSGPTAFMLSRDGKFLLLERNRNGVTSSTFTDYFTFKGGLTGSMGLDMVITPDALQKLTNMTEYRALEVSVATYDDFRAVADQTHGSVFLATHLAREFSAPHISFKVSMGHHGGSLKRGGIMEGVKKLISWRTEKGEDVRAIKVHGREDAADEVTALDLIKNRVVYTENVPISNRPDEWYETRSKLLRQAWSKHHGTLQALLRQDN